MKTYCSNEACDRGAAYVFEWWSLDQQGKNPVVISEEPVCENYHHMLALYSLNHYGFPDGIYPSNDTQRTDEQLLGLRRNLRALFQEGSELDKEVLARLHRSDARQRTFEF